MSDPPAELSALPGLGPRSAEALADIGIRTIDQFMAADPYDMYRRLRSKSEMSLNGLYAIIGAQDGISWLDVAQTRKMEILMRLEDMGIST